MKPFSALYCTKTNSLLEFKLDGTAVRSPRETSEVEYWCHKGSWVYLVFRETLYKEVPADQVPAIVSMALALAQ